MKKQFAVLYCIDNFCIFYSGICRSADGSQLKSMLIMCWMYCVMPSLKPNSQRNKKRKTPDNIQRRCLMKLNFPSAL